MGGGDVERLVFVGASRVGLALGYALAQADAVESLVYHGRREEPPPHPLFFQGLAEYRFGLVRPEDGTTAVFLTVPDEALAEMAMEVAALGEPPPGCVAFHCSGTLGADPLEALHARGYRVGTLHPFQGLANPVVGAERLVGAWFALSGGPQALAVARRIVSALGGRGITVPTTQRPVYHAASVMASSYLVVLLGEAMRLFRTVGVSDEETEGALTSWARGTLEDVAELGVDAALAGPVRRGDVEVVGLHLRALDAEDRELYSLLGRRALDRVRDELDPGTVEELEQLFRRREP
jgi:predicted short-subunit dehydrogenase-like oxidoreductase (DUF2520 family)